MLEAKLNQSILLKKILEAVKDLAKEVNIDCSEEGLSVQAMDSSHVALTAIELRKEAFEPYRCDRDITIGINLESLSKILRSAGNDDMLTLRKSDDSDNLELTFDAKRADRTGEYEMKLLDIDAEHLGIPDREFEAVVELSTIEFSRIIRDLSVIGEAITIEVDKESVTFSCTGDIGKAKLTLKNGATTGAAPDSDAEEEDEDSDEDVKPALKKRKTASTSKGKKAAKDTPSAIPVKIRLEQKVKLDFAGKYLLNFTKAAGLCDVVKLHLQDSVPMMVSFEFENGHVQFFLAPKFEDDADDEE